MSDTTGKPQTPGGALTADGLPRLYTLKEVREATQYGTEKLRRVLLAHPEVPRIGKGRGTRLTYEAYMQLLEALRPRQFYSVTPLPDGELPSREELARRRIEWLRRGRRSSLVEARRKLLGDG